MLGHDLGGGAFAGEHAGDGLLGQFVVELAVGDELLDLGHVGRGHRQLLQRDALGVRLTGELAQPPLLGAGRTGAGGHGGLDQVEGVGVDHVAHLQVGEAPLALQAVAAFARHLRHLRGQTLDVLLGDVQHHQIRIREVAVVVRVGLDATAGGGLRGLVPVAGLLQHLAAVVQDGGLAADLVLDGLLDAAERVHVLGFGAGAERVGRVAAQRHVHVGAHVALLHAGVRDVQRTHDVAQRTHVGAGDLLAAVAHALDRLGNDLDQRHAGTVVVDQRVVRTLDAAVGAADVRVLAGVVLDVGAFDRHAEDRAVIQFHVQVAVAVGRLVVLGDLVVARHVRVEVVLAGELAPFGDLAVQGQAQLDRVVHGGLVEHRQGAGQTEGDRGQLRVRIAAELHMRRAEQLGVRAQLDMRLQADDRVELLDGIGVLHQFFSHNVLLLRCFTCSGRRATGSSGTARSGRPTVR